VTDIDVTVERQRRPVPTRPFLSANPVVVRAGTAPAPGDARPVPYVRDATAEPLTRLTPPFGLRLVGRDGDTAQPGPVPQAPEFPPVRLSDRLGKFGIQPLLVAIDALAVLLGPVVLGRVPIAADLLFALILLAMFGLARLHRSRLTLSVLDQLPTIVGYWLSAVAITVLFQAAITWIRWDLQVIKWDVVRDATVTLVMIVVLRALAFRAVRRLRSSGQVSHRTLVLGAGRVGAQIAEVLVEHPEYGLHPIGFLDSDPWLGPKELPLPLLGGTDALYHVLTDHEVHNVVVAFGSMRESAMVDVIRTCDRLDTEIFIVPRLFELHNVSADMEDVWGMPLVRLRRGWQVKRAFDLVVSTLSLVLLAPVLLLAALAVRIEGGPGVIFRQERVGVDGRRFTVMKFRSMRPSNDSESQTQWNIAQDRRVGPIGRFLRKSSIDELPQLINIIRGEMSLVGPRPERPHFVDQFCEAYPRYIARHRVPSGLTGWAQVHGLRGDTSIVDRARFDNYYIENWSLWLDIKIILRTVGSVLRGTGA
jgi:exopolysaccharide biosynthesis polyprenyl glycosylphosphotransferase